MYFVCFCGGLSFILLCFKGLFESFLFFVYILFPSKLVFFYATFRDNSIDFVSFFNLPPQIFSIGVSFGAPFFFFSQYSYFYLGRFFLIMKEFLFPLKLFFESQFLTYYFNCF